MAYCLFPKTGLYKSEVHIFVVCLSGRFVQLLSMLSGISTHITRLPEFQMRIRLSRQCTSSKEDNLISPRCQDSCRLY